MSQLSILKIEKSILWIKKTKKRFALIVERTLMIIIPFLLTEERYIDVLDVTKIG
jgi:hypothetical protein|tara:strand:- start:300 stop:464 length:165 start_codon:yes stop_codon:yes gene_type:complete